MSVPGYHTSFPGYAQQEDGIYSQGNSAYLTCDSGYVINHETYLKSAHVMCNYTPSDGSTWKIVEMDKTILNRSAACIRGKKSYRKCLWAPFFELYCPLITIIIL